MELNYCTRHGVLDTISITMDNSVFPVATGFALHIVTVARQTFLSTINCTDYIQASNTELDPITSQCCGESDEFVLNQSRSSSLCVDPIKINVTQTFMCSFGGFSKMLA